MSGWLKIPLDWISSEEAEQLPAEVVLFHLSALAESGRRLDNGRLAPRALRHLWPVADAAAAVGKLVQAGMWEPVDDGWLIRDWATFLMSSTEIEQRRAVSRESSERYRRHKLGDHTMCERCSFVRDQSRDASPTQSRDASVTHLRTEPNRTEGERRGEGDGPGSASAAPTAAESSVPYSPHAYNVSPECCPLPPHHPIHRTAS